MLLWDCFGPLMCARHDPSEASLLISDTRTHVHRLLPSSQSYSFKKKFQFLDFSENSLLSKMVQLARRNFGKSVRSMVYYSKEVPSKVTNYFDVFKLPVSFHLDLRALHSTYKSLQQQLHPDLNHAASGSATLQGGNALDSSDVNHAYQVLLSPADRVRHLVI